MSYIKKLLELKIAQLERQNTQLEKLMKAFQDLTAEEYDAVLDEINENKKMIAKLKEGLK